jgi:hypothetical protein
MTPETAIKKQIRDYLGYMGWFVFPILQGIGAFKGIADLIACKGGHVIFIEVKTATGKQGPYQIQFESNLHASGCLYCIARSWEDISKFIAEHIA